MFYHVTFYHKLGVEELIEMDFDWESPPMSKAALLAKAEAWAEFYQYMTGKVVRCEFENVTN